MKWMIASDIHGSAYYCRELLAAFEREGAQKLMLLGDVLYHGPRNGVPGFYDPPKVAELLNDRREQILAVRGNCDAEVDQMMLQFPVMADFAELDVDDHRFFLTHGHLWNADNLPALAAGTVLVHGHTHIPEDRMLDCGIRIFNPGSISLPKQQTPQSFGFFDGETLSLQKL